MSNMSSACIINHGGWSWIWAETVSSTTLNKNGLSRKWWTSTVIFRKGLVSPTAVVTIATESWYISLIISICLPGTDEAHSQKPSADLKRSHAELSFVPCMPPSKFWVCLVWHISSVQKGRTHEHTKYTFGDYICCCRFPGNAGSWSRVD